MVYVYPRSIISIMTQQIYVPFEDPILVSVINIFVFNLMILKLINISEKQLDIN